MKKMNLWMVTACLVTAVFFFFIKSNLSILSEISVSLSHSTSTTHQEPEGMRSELISTSKWDRRPPPPLPPPQSSQIICDHSHWNYDICSISGPTMLDPTTSTFFLLDPSRWAPPSLVQRIRPYPRKWEDYTMKRIQELTIISSGPSSSKCEVQHSVPALAFSVGGYTGNFWHEFNDGFIPIFITVNSIFRDHDFVFVISNARDWWVSKYAELLHAFSKHPIINLDRDTTTHCFPSATLGLMSHGYMTIDPSLLPNSKSFVHFHGLLQKAFSRGRNHSSKSNHSSVARPRLVLTVRRGSVGRVILNQVEIKRAVEDIGFEVVVFEPTSKMPLHQAYELLNSSHAMVGVHGAALTHSLFLRPGSVFMQVVPLGLEWVAEVCFGAPARAIGLDYMEYKINAEESSLIEKYNKNDLVIKDPAALRGKDWSDAAMEIYLREQNVKLGSFRFRETLESVFNKAKRFMDNEG